MWKLGDPASSISRKIIGLIKKEIDDVFMPIATVKEKGKLKADITKLYNVEEEKEYIALISPEGFQESEECFLTESEDCGYSPSFYTGSVLVYNDDTYFLCQCVCVRRRQNGNQLHVTGKKSGWMELIQFIRFLLEQ